jgi:flagellar hook-length control protein FliK
LNEFLVSAGFCPKRIAGILDSLEKTSPGRGVRLSELLSQFENMEVMDDKAHTKPQFELSIFPYLESALSQFLKDPEQLVNALEGVKIDGEGILISRLITNLKGLVQNLEDNGKSIPDVQTRHQIAKLMRDLGMETDQDIVTLDRFIQELEALAAKASDTPRSGQIQMASLDRFIENLHHSRNENGNMEKWHLSGKTKTATLNDTRAMAPGRVVPMTELASAPVTAEAKAYSAKEESIRAVDSLDNMKYGMTRLSGIESQTNMRERPFIPEQKATVRTLPTYVMNQVGRQILRSLQRGNPEIQLQLKPPHLGRLHMRVDNGGDGIRVHIVTEHQGTRETLLSHANELKSSLAEQGIKLEKVDIQFDHSFDQSMSHWRQDLNKMFDKRRRKSGVVLNGEPEAFVDDQSERIRAGEGVLDLVA